MIVKRFGQIILWNLRMKIQPQIMQAALAQIMPRTMFFGNR